jgi:hypothetical protein
MEGEARTYLDILAEEAVDAIIVRIKRDTHHKLFLSAQDITNIHKEYTKTQSLTRTAQNLKIPRHTVERIISERSGRGRKKRLKQ